MAILVEIQSCNYKVFCNDFSKDTHDCIHVHRDYIITIVKCGFCAPVYKFTHFRILPE